MSPSLSMEIRDLRHFNAQAVSAVLDVESALWMEKLHWDYRSSSRLLSQYLDNRMLPGVAAVDGGEIRGYAFCVYEESKAVIGDIFALGYGVRGRAGNLLPFSESAQHTESVLFRHLVETLQSSPQIDRIESQLLLQQSGFLRAQFDNAGFVTFPRLYMVHSLRNFLEPQIALPDEFDLRTWREEDLPAIGRLICASYGSHPDSMINDQYRTVHGSIRFLNNIVRYSGCGTFLPPASHVVFDRKSREMVGLVLGSRISDSCGHVTQLCVHPGFRRKGIARLLLSVASSRFARLGLTEISLTVTESNVDAIELYLSEGFRKAHSFDATVWERPGTSTQLGNLYA